MTIRLADIQSALKTWVATLTGLSSAAVIMENEPRPFAGKSVLAILSWVALAGVGSDDIRYRVDGDSPDVIIATGGVSSASPQTYSGAALNGSIGAGAMNPPRVAVLQLSASASWLATTAVVTGLDESGATVTDSLAIPLNGGVRVEGTTLFASITSVAIPAQGGTAGTFTMGTDVPIPDSNATPQTLTCRAMTLQIGIETFDQNPDTNAFLLLEKLRGYIYGPKSQAILSSANLGLIDMDQTTKADYVVDQRWISRAVASVRFNQSDVTDDTTSTTTTIESVDVTDAILAETDGTRVPTPLQWNQHNIP